MVLGVPILKHFRVAIGEYDELMALLEKQICSDLPTSKSLMA